MLQAPVNVLAIEAALESRDWVTYDTLVADEASLEYGIIPHMTELAILDEKDRFRRLLEFYLRKENNENDVIKHVGWAAVEHNRYGILKMMLRMTRATEPWVKNPDARPFLKTALWLGIRYGVPTARHLKMLARVKEAGYTFKACDTSVDPMSVYIPAIHDWVVETLREEAIEMDT